MRKIITILMALLLVFTTASCSVVISDIPQAENSNVVELPPNQKLVDFSWRGTTEKSYLTRPMREGETAEEYELFQIDNYGKQQSKIIIRETMTNKIEIKEGLVP